jgi:hypothetical protein
MKRFYFLLAFFYSCSALGQDNCPIDFIPYSNKILYNQKVIEEIIEPSKYSAFFFGESHTINFEPEFKFNFIKHLNSKYAVKDIFMEIGFSAAYFFNRYLRSGDTTELKNNYLPYLWGHYKDFWHDLYDYNKLLPDSLKLVIHGIDFERKEIFKLLEKAIQKNKRVPSHLEPTFSEIHMLSTNKELFWRDKEFRNALSMLKSKFQKYEIDFKILYGDDFNVVYNALTNKVPPVSTVNPRNKVWIENVKQIIISNNIKKFIGFFGGAHTRYNNSTSLTVSLKKCDYFKGNILNIATIYNNFISIGGANQIFDYGYNEKDVFDKFYNKNCRAVIIKSSHIPRTTFKTESDFVLFAREIIDL